MKQYSIIHVPVLSFFSKSLYRDVCAHWRGTGFAYLLLLLAICWIPLIAKIHRDFGGFVDREAPKIISQVPTITIVDGKASIQEPQPYYIRDPDSGEAWVVIDTTGTIASLADTEARGLVTRTEATFKKSEFETRTFAFKDIREFTLDQDLITHWLGKARTYVAPGFYVMAVLGSFIGRMLQVLLYAAIGTVFASWGKSKRTYGELIRLAVVAVTPCILVKTALSMAQVPVPIAGLWYFLAAMAYLGFGIRAAMRGDALAGASSPPPVPREA